MHRFALLILLVASLSQAQTTQPNIYFGNLHSHTGYSDGTGTPDEAYKYARDIAKLDFLAVTEHNHLLGGENASPEQRKKAYAGLDESSLISAANRFNAPGKFVTIFGQEYSSISKGNHVNILDITEVIDIPNGQFDKLLPWLRDHPDTTGQLPILQFNHPGLGYPPGKIGKNEYGRDDFKDDAGWLAHMIPATGLIEILNGDPPKGALRKVSSQMMENHYRMFLQLGFKLAPVGDQDNHKPDWGTLTETRTAIVASELTRPALLAALRARHCYASEDRNLKVLFRINDHLMGDIVPMPKENASLNFAYAIEDPDEPTATYTLDLFLGTINGPLAEPVKTFTVTGNTNTSASLIGIALKPDQYLYVRVTQKSDAGSDRAWTSPVWFTDK